MPICPHCLKNHPAGETYCPATGKRIDQGYKIIAGSTPANRKNWYLVGGVGVVLIIIGVLMLLDSPIYLFVEKVLISQSSGANNLDDNKYNNDADMSARNQFENQSSSPGQGQPGDQSILNVTSDPDTPPTLAPTDTPIPTATLTPTPVPGTNPIDGAFVIEIPAGEFMMGLTDPQLSTVSASASDCLGALEAAQPAHPVYLDQYWIYQTEVTTSMYQLCVEAGVCDVPNKNYSNTQSNYFGNPNYADFPVVMVNWHDASAYCKWAGGRLPTEAEWEKAARGTDGRLFPWGDQFPNSQLANFNLNREDTTSVFDYQEGASPYGVLNMAGNVYEWVNDWYSGSYYRYSSYENPTGPANESGELTNRAIRGGSWGWDEGCACSASHDWWEEFESGTGVGFRCVLPDYP